MNNTKEYTKIEIKWFNSNKFKKRKLKYLIKFNRGVEPGSKNYGVEGEGRRFIRVNDVGSANKDKVFVSMETDAVCRKEDILLCLDGSPGIVVRGFDGIYSTGLRKLELVDKKLNYDYLFYSLKCDFSQECINFFSKGTTIMHASSAINYLKQPLPEPEEQLAITNFLDEKTKMIDKIIENKILQIGLLEEVQRIFILNAISLGFRKSSYKKSKVEHIEKIPSNWVERKIKYFAKVQRGKFTHRPRDDPRLYDGDYPFIQTGDISQSSKYVENYEQTLNEEGLKISKMFPKGTLLITIAANIGDVSLLGFDSCFPDSIIGIDIFSDTTNEYLYYVLYSLKQNILKYAKINTQMNINEQTIRPIVIPLPPKDEQTEILEKIIRFEKSNEFLREKLKQQIQKLEEYKKILMNEAVTGKIKVTN